MRNFQMDWPSRLRASGIHLCISVLIALAVAALVFGLWYPGPYRELAGGRELFVLLISVDVCLGPLLTLAVFDQSKSRVHLRRDLLTIGALQLLALVYGGWIMFVARPVHLSFEVDRFRVVRATDIEPGALSEAPTDLQRLPLKGPTLIGTAMPSDPQQRLKLVNDAIQGRDISTQPRYWAGFDAQRPEVWRRAKPLDNLYALHPPSRALIDQAVVSTGLPGSGLRIVPVIARLGTWTALVNEAGTPLAFLPLDPF